MTSAHSCVSSFLFPLPKRKAAETRTDCVLSVQSSGDAPLELLYLEAAGRRTYATADEVADALLAMLTDR